MNEYADQCQNQYPQENSKPANAVQPKLTPEEKEHRILHFRFFGMGSLIYGGCKKSCVYGEIIFPDMSQICRNLLSNIATFMLSNFFSDNSIANPLHPIHVF